MHPIPSFLTLTEKYMFKKTLIAAALVVAATGSFAQNYFQGALGQGSVGFDCGTGYTCKKSSTGYKMLFGFDAGNGLSYEGQYINYGKEVPTNNTTGVNANSAKVTGFGGNVAYSGNFNESWGYRVAGGLAINNANDGGSTSTSALKLAVGGGIAYNINKNLALTAEYDFSNATLKYTSSSLGTSVSLLSFGLRAKF
jgi:Outer membrane protein beta-barrel domain